MAETIRCKTCGRRAGEWSDALHFTLDVECGCPDLRPQYLIEETETTAEHLESVLGEDFAWLSRMRADLGALGKASESPSAAPAFRQMYREMAGEIEAQLVEFEVRDHEEAT